MTRAIPHRPLKRAAPNLNGFLKLGKASSITFFRPHCFAPFRVGKSLDMPASIIAHSPLQRKTQFSSNSKYSVFCIQIWEFYKVTQTKNRRQPNYSEYMCANNYLHLCYDQFTYTCKMLKFWDVTANWQIANTSCLPVKYESYILDTTNARRILYVKFNEKLMSIRPCLKNKYCTNTEYRIL